MLETEYILAVESSIQTEVELALEGASNEALKIFSSTRMSDVKDDMREGIELYNKGQYKKGCPNFREINWRNEAASPRYHVCAEFPSIEYAVSTIFSIFIRSENV